MIIDAWTDGGAKKLGSTFYGGWAWVIPQFEGAKKTYTGWGTHVQTTSNAMELQAFIQVTKFIEEHLQQFEITGINIYTDSMYLVNGYTKFLDVWMKKGWVTHNGTTVANIETWTKILQIRRNSVPIKFTWVKSHSGDEHNTQCDLLVKKALNHIIDEYKKL